MAKAGKKPLNFWLRSNGFHQYAEAADKLIEENLRLRKALEDIRDRTSVRTYVPLVIDIIDTALADL